MKRRTGLLALVAAVAALAVVAAAYAKPATKAAPAVAASRSAAAAATPCNKAKLAIMAPLTGDAGFLGVEQLSWAKYAVANMNKLLGMHVGLYQGDTQLDPALASTLAQKYVADPKTMAIIGPSTSGAVVATGPTLAAANLAAISPSATRTTLTIGNQTAGKSFYRDVPNDAVQGPSDAAYMIKYLHAKKVYIIDDEETYSTGLADAAQAYLKAKGVTVIRDSVSQSVTDFSSIVTKVPSDTDVVFIPWQQPPEAQTFAQQMAEQGKKAHIFGSDGTNDPSKFTFAGAYVSNFAPDITGIPADKLLVAGWLKANPGQKVGSFGPPTYGATQIAMLALKAACDANGGKATRAQVLAQVPKVKIKQWILGGSWGGFTRTHDPVGAKFYIFQIQKDGSYKLVG
jgi:branched-chain amino acid transport system substrate-binding protein